MRLLLLGLLVAIAPAAQADEPIQSCDPWTSAYAGEDATGKHVLGLWKFDAGSETADASGRGQDLKIEGAEIRPEGRFGACLECFRGWPVEDKRHRAVTKRNPPLSPKGPFTLELWISPKPELDEKYPDSFLLDKKYASHNDYQLILGPADRSGSRVLRAVLGFGEESSTWSSQSLQLKPGTWYHVAFTYDGAGTGSFFVDGMPHGTRKIDGRKGVSPGTGPLSIGDRAGSYHHGFPGYIDEVRICEGVREFRRVKVQRLSDRACFVRMEPAAKLRFAVTNLQRTPLTDATAEFSASGLPAVVTKIAELAGGGSTVIEFPLDCRLRPDEYRVSAHLKVGGQVPFESRDAFTVRIVPRRLPNQFPVLMWGGVSGEIDRLKEIGFTHVLGVGASVGKVWKAGQPTEAEEPEHVAKTKAMLDEALAAGITVAANLSPGSRMRESHKEFLRIDRKGKPAGGAKSDICGLFPEVQKLCYDVGASVAQTYGQFPAGGAAMIHTEVRGGGRACFHPHDLEAYRKATGAEIPAEINSGMHGVDYAKLPDFPADRVVSDDHPLYRYFQWYWKHGDGWNGLNTAVHRGLKSTGRKDVWTYHDPAVRVAKVFGSGGEVDVLSQWTYSYPDPIRIAVATDELLAMVAGAGRPQQVMKMTQIIWYRSQTAPPAKPGTTPAYEARWEQEQPDAPFITIAPMHLREAFWTKIARPIKGIMYHGWGSLVPTDRVGGYRFTHPQTRWELARLIRQVVRPLGPTLLEVPGTKSDVAYLMSFASEVFAKRGTLGWCGRWLGDGYQAMLWAHLQPEIVFDETIQQRGLDGFRVLVMFDCDVLTASVAERVKQFQARGGIVIGDENLAPAIKPDILVASYKREGRADKDKAALQAKAAEVRQGLDARYGRYLDSSNPDVIPYLRRYKQADYVFVVNDRREYGQYVGHHGLVMENGLPSQAELTIGRGAGVLYDLVEHRQVPAEVKDGRLTAAIALGPCDGRMYLVCDRPIQAVKLQLPKQAARGQHAAISVTVADADGKPVEAIVPVQLTIRDAEGREAELSGSYAAVDGRLAVTLDIAPNDPFGVWTVEARELASGRTAVGSFRVPSPQPWPPDAKPVDKTLANPVQPKG